MPASQDPNFDLSYGWDLGENDWNTGMNSNLKKLGATAFIQVISATTIAEPLSPVSGDRYLLPYLATGTNWAGNDFKLAVYNVNTWEFYAAEKGWYSRCDDGNIYVYDGSVWSVEFIPSDVALNTAERANAETIWDNEIAEVTDTIEGVPGTQVVTNCNFKTDVAGWTVGNSATVTWRTGGIARIAYNGVTDPYIIQNTLEIGEEYIFTGRARGDGTNIPTLKAGATVWTALDAIGWHSFSIIFTATSSLLSLTSGGATSGYVEWDYQYARPFSSTPTTDKSATWITRQNDILHPNDISQSSAWALAGTVSRGATEIIGTALSGSHYVRQLLNVAAGDRTVYAKLRAGSQPWVRMLVNDGTSRYLYVNPTTLEIGDVSGIDDYRVVCDINGYCLLTILIKDALESEFFLGFYPAPSGSSVVYTGDGVSVDSYVTNVGSYGGTMASNVGFADGGASAYPSTLSMEYKDDYHLKHANGQYLTAEGAWVFLKSIDGTPMDESPSNIEAMHQAGLYKKTFNNTWELPQTDVEYYSPKQNQGDDVVYFQKINRTYIVAGQQTLLTATNWARIVASGGDIIDTVVTPVTRSALGQYRSVTKFSGVGLDISSGDLQLDLGSDYSAIGDGCELWFEYTK